MGAYVCLNCHTSFKSYGIKKFCSPECYHIYRTGKPRIERKTAHCLNCSEPFEVIPSTEKKQFCSPRCARAYSKGKSLVGNIRRVVVTCDHCGKQFERTPFRAAKGKRRFCSHACRNAHGARDPAMFYTCTCEQCGILFARSAGQFHIKRKMHFCSQDCHHTWQKEHNPKGADHPEYNSVEVPCGACGKLLTRPRYRVEATEHQFCNKKCAAHWRGDNIVEAAHPNWKGGDLVGYRGPNWKAQSTLARSRAGYSCEHCGKHEKKHGRKLDVHHLKPFREFGYIPGVNDNYKEANRLDNLIALCRLCHKRAEFGKIALQPRLI